MKAKQEVDLMFAADGWRSRRAGSVGALVLAVAIAGLALGLAPSPGTRTFAAPPVVKRAAVLPADRFTVIAPANIDPRMVIQASPDLDATMVFDPATGRRKPSARLVAPAVGPVAPLLNPMSP